MNDLLMNAQGQCYINSNMKMLSLKLLVKKRFIAYNQRLQEKLSQCQTDKCLREVEKGMQEMQKKQSEIETYFKAYQQRLEYEYDLCSDMIYDSDIRICRKEAKQNGLKQLGYFLNQLKLKQWEKDVCLSPTI